MTRESFRINFLRLRTNSRENRPIHLLLFLQAVFGAGETLLAWPMCLFSATESIDKLAFARVLWSTRDTLTSMSEWTFPDGFYAPGERPRILCIAFDIIDNNMSDFCSYVNNMVTANNRIMRSHGLMTSHNSNS